MPRPTCRPSSWAVASPTTRPPSHLPDEQVQTPETQPLDDLIAHRVRELTAYQNAAYAQTYADRIAKVRGAEVAVSGEASALPLTRAAAVNLYKLMAYKDEYEVARLYTDGRFATALAGTFKGGKTKVWLAPPLLAPKGPDGKPKKIAFGGWILDVGFPVLAKLKGLRGGPLSRSSARPKSAGWSAA